MATSQTQSAQISWEQVVRQAGQRVTPQRRAIYAALSYTPCTVTQLLADTTVRELKLDQVTVYRTLDALVDLKLVNKTFLGSRGAAYELAASHHHHAVCQSCGVVSDVHVPEEQLVLAVQSQSKFVITNHLLEFFGLCQNCQKK